MRTVTLDILNDKALNLLKDLELLKIIRVRWDKEPVKEQTVFLLAIYDKSEKENISDKELDELLNQLSE